MPDTKRRAKYRPGSLCRVLAILSVLACLGSSGAAQAQRLSMTDAPVRDVIAAIESRTDWHFLYRDALLSGQRVTVDASLEESVEHLGDALRPLGLALAIDEERRQILVHVAEALPRPVLSISGRVVDDETGTPLPFATVTWVTGDRLRGVVADGAGHFDVRPGDVDRLEVTVSYIGYDARVMEIVNGPATRDLAVRLVPRAVVGTEVLVSGTMLMTELDTTWHHLLRTGGMAPLGESGVIRSLQALPSVSISPGMSDGLTVRGSQADGFQVLLDGMPVYNQSHLFGLFDAFNDDALQTVGLFYGIAPASYQAPPGGTLSFITRTGSMTGARAAAAISNTSVRGTIEGPFKGGSFLLSARRSLLSSLDLFGGTDLVAVGLDLGRPTSQPSVGVAPAQAGLRLSGDPDASYFDVHLRTDLESRTGARLTVSGYLGGDEAGYSATRTVRLRGQGNGPPGTDLIGAGTDARWGSGSSSVSYLRPVGSGGVSTTMAGYTRYHSAYSKEDFVYTGRGGGPPAGQPTGRPDPQLALYSNYSNLGQLRMSQDWSLSGGAGSRFTFGAVLDAFSMHLEEESLARNPFALDRDVLQADAFASAETARGGLFSGEVGLRTHYYGLGSRLALSPRVRVSIADGSPVSASLGYSRNHQFLHRISLEHQGYTDLWVLSGRREQPTRVNYFTAGVYLRASDSILLQVEAYAKDYSWVRLHQTVAESRGFLSGSALLNPWLADADGSARGVEIMLRHTLGPVVMSHGYTWSRSVLLHPSVQGGVEFAAPWDRRHQYSTTAQVRLAGSALLSATWMIGTGLPNSLQAIDAEESPRLAVYHRLDATLDVSIPVAKSNLEMRLGLFNVYDRDNTWYRSLVPVIMASDRTGRVVETTAVDVYDLGFRPSIEVRYRF